MKITKQRKIAPMTIGFSLAALLAGCGGGGLGDGVKLEQINIRTTTATLDSDDGQGDNLTIGQCIFAPFSILARFTDDEFAEVAPRARWTSSDTSRIVIVNNLDPNNSRNQQFPLAIAPSAIDGNGNPIPITLTADFAGEVDQVNVTVLPSTLQLELTNRKFAVGVETPISARLVTGTADGPRLLLDRTNQTNYVATGSAGIQIGSPDDDSDDTGLINNGTLLASDAGSAEITATLDSLQQALDANDQLQTSSGVSLLDKCQLSATVMVEAIEPTGLEIAPDFVSANADNQSSANSLFLASGTSANVTVNALLGDDERQDVTELVTWRRTEADQNTQDGVNSDDNPNNDVDLLPLPGFGSGVVSAGSDDHLISPDPEIIAVLVRGVADDSGTEAEPVPADDLADLQQNLTVMVDNYDSTEIELVLQPEDGGALAFSAASPLRLFGLFGNPNRDDLSGELVLRLRRGLVPEVELFNADGELGGNNDSPAGELTALGTVSLSDGAISAFTKIGLDAVDNVAAEQRVSYSLINIVDENNSGVTEKASNTQSFSLSETDLQNIPAGSDLVIALAGDSSAAGATCIEIGQTVDFDSLVTLPDEAGDPATPVLPARVTGQSVWSVSDADVAAVSNEPMRRGQVSAVATGSADLQVTYVNNIDRAADGTTTGSRFAAATTLPLTVMSAGQCD